MLLDPARILEASSSMSDTTRYCRSCARRVSVEREDPHCPQCGDTLDAWVDSPTVQLDDVKLAEEIHVGDEPAEALVGNQLATYRIEKFLGQGGMARVYLATHTTLERLCAIKVLRPRTLARDDQAVESFLAEARSAAALTHPHVVTLYTIGEDAGRHFLEMEYVDGCSLNGFMREAGPLDPLTATQFMFQVASALAVAHDMNMIHRDIKPANVMVTNSRVAKLADFGLAKRVCTKSPNASGALCGTPNFMAPELFCGQAASTRSDIYAMGVTFFSLLTGHLPVETKSVNELIRYHAANDLLEVSQIDDELPSSVAAVLRRCLGRNQNTRFEEAGELRDELRAVLGGLRSLDSLLKEAFAGHSIRSEQEGARFKMRVPLADGRAQTVHVEAVTDAETGEEIIRVLSVCGPTSPCYFERALHLNASISHGAIGIEDVDGRPHFVMVNAYPRATCDPEEIYKSVLDIAKHADHVEHLLTGEDNH